MRFEENEVKQQDIFQPATRNTDPITSHIAEATFTALGKRAHRCRQVLQLIVDSPGATTGELSRYMHTNHPELPISCAVESPHKRVTDLEEKGLVRRGGIRKCRDSGNLRITWYATAGGLSESS